MRVGRIKIRLAAMLTEAGFPLEPDDLDRNYETGNKWDDGPSWTAYSGKTHLYSYDSMTTLVRHGLIVLGPQVQNMGGRYVADRHHLEVSRR